MGYDGSIRIDTSIDGSGFQGGLKKISSMAGSAIQGITTLIAGASAALGAGALAGVKYNAQMEQYVTSFGTMLGSAAEAQAMIGDLKKFAADTPFELTDLAKGAQTLLAFGTAQEKVMPTMKMIGDISQGNKEKFDSLTLAFAQISSTGKLTGQDLLQCINAGFNPLNEISKKTGKSMAELKEDMSKGAISADMVSEAFAQATSEGGQFYKAMEAQSKTFNGQMSTLKDNAMSFIGELTEGFSTSLKDTALPMVNGWLSQMQGAFKSGGMTALSASMGDVISNAAVAAAEQSPGVIDSASKVISSFAKGLADNQDKLVEAGIKTVSALVKGVASVFPREISQPIKAAMNDIENSLNSGGLKSGIETFKKLISNAASAVSKIAKVALPVLTKGLDILGGNLHIVVPVAVAFATAVTAWKIAQQSKTWITVASKAIEALTLSTAKGTAGALASNGALALTQLGYGVLTGKVSLATAAQTIYNAVLNANPIGLVITAIAALAAGFAMLTLATNDTKSAVQQGCKALDNMSDGATKFRNGIGSAESKLSEFNDTLFASSEEQAQLQANMEQVQTGITTICRTATQERRGLTAAEIQELDTYFVKLNELNARELEIEAAKMEAIEKQAIAASQNRSMSIAEYEQQAQQWTATAREQKDNQLAILREQTTSELVLLDQQFEQRKASNAYSLSELNSWYNGELTTIQASQAEQEDIINSSMGNITAAFSNGYAARSSVSKLETDALIAEQQRYVESRQRLDDTTYISADRKKQAYKLSETLHQQEMAKIWNDMTANMTEAEQEQIGIYLNLVTQAEVYGGELATETRETATNIVAAFDNMPADMRQVAIDMMSPMLEEMERMEPILSARANSIAGGMLGTMRRALDEHSPSRATRKIFRYAMLGARLGLEDETESLNKQAETITSDMLRSLTPNDMTKYITQMRSAAAQTQSAFTARFAAQADYAALTLSPTTAPASTNVTFNQTNVSPEPLSASQLTRNAQDMLNWQQNKWRLP